MGKGIRHTPRQNPPDIRPQANTNFAKLWTAPQVYPQESTRQREQKRNGKTTMVDDYTFDTESCAPLWPALVASGALAGGRVLCVDGCKVMNSAGSKAAREALGIKSHPMPPGSPDFCAGGAAL